jgi:hypothetical protein
MKHVVTAMLHAVRILSCKLGHFHLSCHCSSDGDSACEVLTVVVVRDCVF